MKKIKIHILVTFICLLITNSLFAQENPHDRMVKRMKESGLTDKEIEKELKEMDAFHQKHIDEEFQRIQEEITKKQTKGETQRTNITQSTTSCNDIPAAEKLALKAIYDHLNGSSWATNWDFSPTSTVTSWNGTTGWYGITLNSNCRVESINISGNVQGVFQDVSAFQELKSLTCNHGAYGHNLPYYITGDFSSIGNLPLLSSLYLTNANFQGEMPSSFNYLDSEIFTSLTLAHCNLNYDNFLTICSSLPDIVYLNLSHNFIAGSFPENYLSRGEFSQLKHILMDSNNISNISELGLHTQLETISFANNYISQYNFPNLSANLNLKTIILDYNQIGGQIPNNLPNKINILRLSNNYFRGNIPIINNSTRQDFYRVFDIRYNNYKFKDIENIFNHYQNQTYFSDFFYSNQPKTDQIYYSPGVVVSPGSSYTMTMHTDGNFSNVEQYQWYKNGELIPGATQRQYTINNITTAHAGSYYCVSKHPSITIPSNSFKNLTLVTNPIPLRVTNNNCPPLGLDIETSDYPCINQPLSFSLGIGAIPSVTSLSWKIIDSNDTIIHTFSGSYLSYTFNQTGTYTIKLSVTTTNGCSYTLLKTVEVFPTCTSCTETNPNTSTVKQLFINLINHLRTLQSVPNGYTCPQLTLLAPYVQEDGPIAIYNFVNEFGQIYFSFANHGGQNYGNHDVWIVFNENNPVQDIDLTEYVSYNQRTLLLGKIIFANGSISKGYVKHIDFCSTSCPPLVGVIQPRIGYECGTSFETGFSFSNFVPGQQYSWTFINPSGNVFATSSFAGTNLITFDQIGTYIINLVIITADGCTHTFSKNITITPCTNCTASNPNTPIIKQYFINLINHLKTLSTSSVPNGYTCPQLTLLAPYVQPFSTVAIYNFTNSGGFINFSFVNNGTGASTDIKIPYNAAGNTITDINLANYTDFSTTFTINTHLSNGTIDTTNGYIKNIEFCPDELFCTKHIAIVVDESGSIDETEARKIRFQLKSFIEQQTVENETLGSNVRVSLIGLSDSDNFPRPDHVTPSGRLTSTNKSDYLTWINKYKTVRNPPVNGVSPNSDYWKSGLDKALEINAALVILITDGCQTANAGNLKETVRKFNNNNGGNANPNAPHLFVIGLDNGFYVNSDTPSNGRQAYNREEDPNLNPSVQRSAGSNLRVASFLRTSLKFLMGYDGSEFPVNNKYNFVLNPFDGSMVDYYGANDFLFFYDEPNYLYNGSVRTGTSCGELISSEKCDNCLNFKPTPGKEYIVSAWAMEELKVQVKDFTNPEIHIRFIDLNDVFIPYPEGVCVPTGDIIDGWQRIFKKFTVPENTVYIEIALVNKSGNVPVYFDDIRIHPLDGSMKSFVYDPETFRLMSELDENNYSTFYEYDNEGGLVRVKKETSRGVKTIQETRSGNVIKVD